MLKKATLALAASILLSTASTSLMADEHQGYLDPRHGDFWASLNLASRLSGAVGRSDISVDGEDADSFAGFLTSSTAFQFYGLNFQTNSTFLYDDYDEGIIKTYGSSLHVNRRDPSRYMYGINLAHHTFDVDGVADLDVARIGVEGEYYRDRLTLGLATGYTEFDSDEAGTGTADGWYFKAQARFYIHDNFKIEGYYGHVDIEADGDDGEFKYGSVQTVARLPGTSAALFARWNGLWIDSDGDADGESHQVLFGAKFDLGNARGGTLKDNDRMYFTDACLMEAGATPFC